MSAAPSSDDPVLLQRDGAVARITLNRPDAGDAMDLALAYALGACPEPPAVTIDRQCGSSQQSIHFAAQAVMSGAQDVVIAARAESMTRAPMFSNTALHDKAGVRTGPVSPRIRRRQPRGRRGLGAILPSPTQQTGSRATSMRRPNFVADLG